MTHELVLPSVRFDEVVHVGLSEWSKFCLANPLSLQSECSPYLTAGLATEKMHPGCRRIFAMLPNESILNEHTLVL